MKKRINKSNIKNKNNKNIKKDISKNNKKNNYIYNNFIIGLNNIKNSRNYIYFSFILFVVIGLIGFFYPHIFTDKINEMIKNLVDQTKGLGPIGMISYIITNNIRSAFFAFLFGVLFGVVPMGILVVNGYVLGYVASKATNVGGISVLWRLFPHGIFEIPAIMISIGLGIRIGLFLFIYKGKSKDMGEEYKKWFIDSIKSFVFVVIPLLVIAGIIEGSLISILG